MAKFNFKSVGTKPKDRQYDTTRVSKVQNIGIKTPLSNAKGEEIFDMHQDPRDQVKDNLKNLILTNEGERVCLSGFGANLKNLVFEYSNQKGYETSVAMQIRNAVRVHMPRILINDITTSLSDGQEKFESNDVGVARLLIRIVYSVPIMRIKDQGLEVQMFVGG